MYYGLFSTLFWMTALLLVFVYAGYPAILLVWVRLRKPLLSASSTPLPSFSLFIPAYNEQEVIAKKIENALAIRYPRDLLEIVIASDGSTDQTVEIARRYADRGVNCFASDENLGKNHLINSYAPKTRGDIIVFTDANALFAPNCLEKLAAAFSHPHVGCVGGRLRYLRGDSSVAKGEGLYFRYENLLRRWEGRLGRAVGANGAIYAIRRNLFEPVPGHVPNDFFHPLVALRKGHASTFARDAVAYEKPTENQGEEFNRRMRIVARSVAAIPASFKVPGSYPPGVWFCLLSHKFLRWLSFPILMTNLLANLLLSGSPFFLALLAAQFTFYTCGILGYWGERVGVRLKALYVPYYFLLINTACFFGLLHWLTGRKFVRWQSASTTR